MSEKEAWMNKTPKPIESPMSRESPVAVPSTGKQKNRAFLNGPYSKNTPAKPSKGKSRSAFLALGTANWLVNSLLDKGLDNHNTKYQNSLGAHANHLKESRSNFPPANPYGGLMHDVSQGMLFATPAYNQIATEQYSPHFYGNGGFTPHPFTQSPYGFYSQPLSHENSQPPLRASSYSDTPRLQPIKPKLGFVPESTLDTPKSFTSKSAKKRENVTIIDDDDEDFKPQSETKKPKNSSLVAGLRPKNPSSHQYVVKDIWRNEQPMRGTCKLKVGTDEISLEFSSVNIENVKILTTSRHQIEIGREEQNWIPLYLKVDKDEYFLLVEESLYYPVDEFLRKCNFVPELMSDRHVAVWTDLKENGTAARLPSVRTRSATAAASAESRSEARSTRRQSAPLPPVIPPPATNNELFKYPETSKFSIVVREHDAHRLNEGEYLNDTIIEFYLRYLREHNHYPRTYFFNTFFYNQLLRKDTSGASREEGSSIVSFGYEKIRKWTANVDIFEMDYLIMPICEAMHWYLVIIYNPRAILDAVDQDFNGDDGEEMEEDELLAPGPKVEVKLPKVDITTIDISDTETDHQGTQQESQDNAHALGPAEDEIDQLSDVTNFKTTVREEVTMINNITGIEMTADEFAEEYMNSDLAREEEESNVVQIQQKLNEVEAEPSTPNVIDVEDDAVQFVGSKQKVYEPKANGRKKTKEFNESPTTRKKQTTEEKNRKNYVKYFSKCNIIILDSLGLGRSGTISKVKEYLILEAFHKKNLTVDKSIISGVSAKVPTQPNHCDCGVYVLQFIETFLREPVKYVDYIINRLPKQSEWFVHADIVKKRKDITKIIKDLTKEQINSPVVPDSQVISDDDDVEIVEIG